MKLNFCVVCGSKNDLQQHHIEPVVYSRINRNRKNKKYDDSKQLKDCTSMEIFAFLFDRGVISEEGTLTVCSYHHQILHGIIKFQKHEHQKLILEGLKKAKAKGTKLGRPTRVTENTIVEVMTLRESGTPIHIIAKNLRIGVGTTQKILKEYNK